MATKRREKSLSPTNLAVYHHNHCELYLWNSYHGRQYNSGGESRRSSLVSAQFERGVDWEQTLVSWLDDQELLLSLGARLMTGQDLRAILQLEERDHFFIYGLKFQSPDFLEEFERHGNGSKPVNFGIAKPDLVEFTVMEGGRIMWSVIDAKASKKAKTSHHVQIYWYHLCLAQMLEDPMFFPSETASIWLPPHGSGFKESPSFETMEPVAVSLLGPPLEEFFFRTLPKIVYQIHVNVPWHFNSLCRGCPFEYDCRDRAVTEQALGRMSEISLSDAGTITQFMQHARKLSTAGGEEPFLSDLEELDAFCRHSSLLDTVSKAYPINTRRTQRILQLPKKGSSLRMFGSPKLNAALMQKPQIINRRNYTLPANEDIAVIISLVFDPSQSTLGAYCINTFTSGVFSRSEVLQEPCFGLVSPGSQDIVTKLSDHLNRILALNDDSEAAPRSQIYVFSSMERAALQQYLIQAALAEAPDTSLGNDITGALKTCIGAFCEGSELLATIFQPLILSGGLLGFLHKKQNLTQEQLRMVLLRLGIECSPNALREEMRELLEGGIARLQQTTQLEGDFNLGALSRVVAVRDEISKLIALPIPGYWDLQDAVSTLLSRRRSCPSDDDIYAKYRGGDVNALKADLILRNKCIYDLLKNVRKRVDPIATGGAVLLLNQARPLASRFMDICYVTPLRKLFFMHQFEVLTKLQTLWSKRIDGCPDAPVLEYTRQIYLSNGAKSGYEQFEQFKLVSGSIEPPSERDKSMFDYILVPDQPEEDDAPPETLFDDLSFSGLVFPLNKTTSRKWFSHSIRFRENVAVAHVYDIGIDQGSTAVVVRAYRDKGLFKFIPGRRYRLSHRLVDFNTSKVLNTLVEIDLGYAIGGDSPAFMNLLSKPDAGLYPVQRRDPSLKREQDIHRQYRELQGLGVESAGALVLKASQRKATRRILTSDLAVIWGPPGTGKTYTIALSFLRMIEVEARLNSTNEKIVFVTAMTHAAIEAILEKLSSLIDHYRNIPHLPIEWLDSISIQHVKTGIGHPLPSHHHRVHLYAGTVFQLWHFSRRLKTGVDVVIVDEAGQLCLGYVALVMRNMKHNAKLVVAGDNEQLAPIFSAEYPETEGHLFGSVLDCLMVPCRPLSQAKDNDVEVLRPGSPEGDTIYSSQTSTVVQLLENFRLNPDLGAFISTIYSKSLLPQKSQAKELATQLIGLEHSDEDPFEQQASEVLIALGSIMLHKEQSLFTPPSRSPQVVGNVELGHRTISLALLTLNATSETGLMDHSYETHVKAEAALAAALVHQFQRCAPDEHIFVATPHRIQRQAVRIALDRSQRSEFNAADDQLTVALDTLTLDDIGTPAPGVASQAPRGARSNLPVRVDTIERLQGSEAGFVICLFSHTHTQGVSLDTSRLSFLLNRRRLNVAISRAKTLCIFVTSKELLRPPAAILADPESTKGYMYLRAYEERACCANLTVNLDPFA